MFILGEILKEKKITSKELAERTGISKRTIDEYRQRNKAPSLEYGLKIAAALGMRPEELVRDDADHKSQENKLSRT